jgi:uncharacterized protein
MKKQKIIIDTGALVAFFNKSDYYHKWAISQFSILKPPFYTCEAVISETCFLLKNYKNGATNIFKLIDRELIKIPFILKSEINTIDNLMDKYRNIPMSLADGCLVRMAEQITDSVILTIDSDFKIYRKNKRKIIPVIMPNDFE